MRKKLKKLLKRIVSLAAYADTISHLNGIDDKQVTAIFEALSNAVEENHKEILEAKGSRDKLRYLLYREAVEIKSHTSSYLSYSETMAIREANLWKFALTITEQFFDLIFAALDDYFAAKKQIMHSATVRQSTWHTTITDSSKKLISSIN
jgi:hypothetical protein